MRRRRIWWGIALLAVGAGLTILFIRPKKPLPLPVVTFSDGTTLTVRAVTVSRHPKFHYGSYWQRLASKLPGSLGRRWSRGSALDLGDQGRPVLTIWFSSDATNSGALVFRGAVKDKDGATLLGTHFFLSTRILGAPAASTGLAPPGQDQLLLGGLILEAWPRREKELTISVRNNTQAGEPLGTFTLPNPEYGRYPQWQPEPLPAAREVSGTTFTLQAVNVENVPSYLSNPFNNTQPSRSAALYFQVQEHGTNTQDWQPMAMLLTDATGNWVTERGMGLLSAPRMDFALTGKTIGTSCFWPAMPGEQAVKVQVEFVRTGNLESNALFTLRGLPASLAGPFRTNVPAGRVALYPAGRERMMLMPPNTRDLASTNYCSRRFIFVSAVDQEGRAQRLSGDSQVALAPEATTVDITLAAPPVHWLEWTVPVTGTRTNR